MNKLFIIMFIFVLSGTVAYAASLDSALKNSCEPGYFSVILSLIFVICLIYVTGIIYNKLNHLGIKTLRMQNKEFIQDRISIISTTPLGANRTLHVVELNGRKMLIGASANSIHLIKDLSETEAPIQESCSMKELVDEKEKTNNISKQVNESNSDDEFGLYKKYLR